MAFKEGSEEYTERYLGMYLSRHPSPGAIEAYEFDVKIQKPIHIPEEIRVSIAGQTVDEIFWDESRRRLERFAMDLQLGYDWISAWFQAGRSGGWLVLETNDPVYDAAGKIPDYRKAAKRLRSLQRIELRVKYAKNAFVREMESIGWWKELFPTLFRIPPGIKEWRPPE